MKRQENGDDCIIKSSIIRMIKVRRVRWEGHVARMGRRGTHIGVLWEIHKERDN
jgi:hypothetical protein